MFKLRRRKPVYKLRAWQVEIEPGTWLNVRAATEKDALRWALSRAPNGQGSFNVRPAVD